MTITKKFLDFDEAITITKKHLDYDELNFHITEKYDILATTYDLQHADYIIVENEQTD